MSRNIEPIPTLSENLAAQLPAELRWLTFEQVQNDLEQAAALQGQGSGILRQAGAEALFLERAADGAPTTAKFIPQEDTVYNAGLARFHNQEIVNADITDTGAGILVVRGIVRAHEHPFGWQTVVGVRQRNSPFYVLPVHASKELAWAANRVAAWLANTVRYDQSAGRDDIGL